MNIKVFEQFEGKTVTIYTDSRNFSGIFMLDIADSVAVLHPQSTYDQIRYGLTVVDLTIVTAIKEIKPSPRDALSDLDECCDKQRDGSL
jgi:hypothetical protein